MPERAVEDARQVGHASNEMIRSSVRESFTVERAPKGGYGRDVGRVAGVDIVGRVSHEDGLFRRNSQPAQRDADGFGVGLVTSGVVEADHDREEVVESHEPEALVRNWRSFARDDSQRVATPSDLFGGRGRRAAPSSTTEKS